MTGSAGVIDLQTETITSLNQRMAAGEISARSLTEHCLERIEMVNPQVNAILEVNPDALEIADQLDRERASDGPRSLLHGLPILVKDNLDTADKMMTTAGSLALVGSFAGEDAFVVKKLRQAGAVILGKTNLSEWANYRSPRSSSGWSSRGGQTRNPYSLDRSPGGSSSGSAVAVAAGLCVAAIGTETDGSIVSPSSMNSIVGFKPTVGLVGRSGIIPISDSQDTAGPMARCVEDAAILLEMIAGIDPADDITTRHVSAAVADIQSVLSAGGLEGARIGIARNYCGFHERVDDIIASSISAIKRAGGEVVDDLTLVTMADIRPHEGIVMSTEFKAGLDKYLSGTAQETVRSLADVIAFNEQNSDQVMPYFRQELHEAAQARGGLSDPDYLAALDESRRLARDAGIDSLLGEHQLDAIVTPTTCPPWLIDWVDGDNRSGASACAAAVAGYPSVTVPAGYVFGLPVGLSFFSTADTDANLLKLAYAFEQKTRVRVAPELREHADFG